MKQFLNLLFLFFIHTLFSQQQEIEVTNISINSKYAELGVIYLPNNEVIFTSSQKIETDKPFSKNRRRHNRELYLELFKGTIDENGDIINTSRFTKDVFNKFFEADFCFTPDFKKIYFTWNNFFNSQPKKSKPEEMPLFLFSASVDKNFKLSNIAPLRFNSNNYSIKSPVVSKDGKFLYLSSNMPNGYGGFDIYVVSILENGTHSWPKNLGAKINTSKDEMYPFVDTNNTLYFSSSGHKGKGNLDIFKSEFKNNQFSEVQDLPAPINSKFNDFYFVIDNTTNTGYFTSDRQPGKGNVDIYAFKNKEIVCKQLITGKILNNESKKLLNDVHISLYQDNVLKETQTVSNSFEFEVNCNKSYKIVAEKENFILAEIDINTSDADKINITEILELTPIKCDQFINLEVFNSESKQLLNNTTISLYQNNTLKETKLINGIFKFELKCNETYKIIAEKENFKPAEIIINTDNVDDLKISKTLNLTPIKCNQLITGIVLDKNTNKPLPNSIITFYKTDALIDSIQVNSEGTFKYPLKCKTNYKITASHENYISNSFQLLTSEKHNLELTKKILLDTSLEFVTIRKVKMIKTNPIYFDLDQAKIRPDAAKELDKVVAVLLKYPTIKLKIKSHTDSRAPDNYNMILSNKRATSTINYIISKGINPARISGRGYGETELVNKCSNGVKCTNTEHQLNRRTEFIVIDE